MPWTQRTMESTRGQLLSLLRRSRRSINGLAEALQISDNAVRTHVVAMQRDGLVEEAGVERSTGGKPAQLYQVTAAAEEMFPKAYGPVLSAVLQLLEEREGPEGLRELLRDVGARAAGPPPPPETPLEDRVRAAAAVLRRLGGDLEVEQTADGWHIRGYSCPLGAVVREHGETCALTEALVAGVTGEPVRECCDRGDRPRCAFLVGRAAVEKAAGGA